jgi:UDP-N-acetylglucosamine 2-epimerase
VRLAAVAAAQRGPQLVVESTGRLSVWSGTEPPHGSASLRATAVFNAVSAAIERTRPDIALSAGDDDAALSSALAASRADVPIARLAAGRRCGDRGAGREINRIAIDELAARLYTDSAAAGERLRAEGFDERTILHVGSTSTAPHTRRRRCPRRRPSPVRSATSTSLLCLAGAGLVVTDSGSIQEETTLLGVPCYPLARTSECIGTLTHGTNTLLGDDPAAIADLVIVAGEIVAEPVPLGLEDAGRRVADDLLRAPWEAV